MLRLCPKAGKVIPVNFFWKKIDKLCLTEENKVVAWRRDIHQNPELGNREFRTSKLIAEHLKKLGLEVQTGVAHTGVVGILKGKWKVTVHCSPG